MKAMIALIFTVLSFNFAQAYDVNYQDDVECLQGISKPTCSSEGYWEGKNRSACSVNFRVKVVGKGFEIRTITETSYSKTETGMWALLTLGASDAVANQFGAIGVRQDAKEKIEGVIDTLKLIPTCGH